MTPTEGNPNGYPKHAVEMLQKLATITADVSNIKEKIAGLRCEEHVALLRNTSDRMTRVEENKADKVAVNRMAGMLTTIGAAVGAVALFIARKVGT